MMTDPIADMLTRMRNQLRIHGAEVDMPFSRVKAEIARVLKEEGYVSDFREVGEGARRKLRVYLKYGPRGEEVIQYIQRVSRPGCRVYRGVQDLGRVLQGLGVSVVSTPKGIMSDRRCRQEKVGGEVLCAVH